MRRPLAAIAQNGIFRSNRSSVSSGAGRKLPHSRLQQLLLLLLLLSVVMVLYMGHGHSWPGMQALHVPHGSLMPHHTAAANNAVRKPQTLQKFTGNLAFPLWWHAPFIAQSGMIHFTFLC